MLFSNAKNEHPSFFPDDIRDEATSNQGVTFHPKKSMCVYANTPPQKRRNIVCSCMEGGEGDITISDHMWKRGRGEKLIFLPTRPIDREEENLYGRRDMMWLVLLPAIALFSRILTLTKLQLTIILTQKAKKYFFPNVFLSRDFSGAHTILYSST